MTQTPATTATPTTTYVVEIVTEHGRLEARSGRPTELLRDAVEVGRCRCGRHVEHLRAQARTTIRTDYPRGSSARVAVREV